MTQIFRSKWLKFLGQNDSTFSFSDARHQRFSRMARYDIFSSTLSQSAWMAQNAYLIGGMKGYARAFWGKKYKNI